MAVKDTLGFTDHVLRDAGLVINSFLLRVGHRASFANPRWVESMILAFSANCQPNRGAQQGSLWGLRPDCHSLRADSTIEAFHGDHGFDCFWSPHFREIGRTWCRKCAKRCGD